MEEKERVNKKSCAPLSQREREKERERKEKERKKDIKEEKLDW